MNIDIIICLLLLLVTIEKITDFAESIENDQHTCQRKLTVLFYMLIDDKSVFRY